MTKVVVLSRGLSLGINSWTLITAPLRSVITLLSWNNSILDIFITLLNIKLSLCGVSMNGEN